MYAEHAPAISRCKTFISSKDISLSLDTKRIGGAERDRTADPLLAKQVLSQLSYSPSSSITQDKPRFGNNPHQPHSIIPNPHSHMQMVGPGRLELPTPRLSSVCSNQLSYGPISLRRRQSQAKPRKGSPIQARGRRRSSGAPRSAAPKVRTARERKPMVRYPFEERETWTAKARHTVVTEVIAAYYVSIVT